MPEEKNHFALSWNQTQILLLHKRPLLSLDHAFSAKGCQDAIHQKEDPIFFKTQTKEPVKL